MSFPPVAAFVCATTVQGNVIIQQVTGGIGICTHIPGLDPPTGLAARCGSVRNEIGGNLIVSNNSSFRALVQNNIVHGNMRVVHNTGPGPKVVTGNEVDRSLACVANEEPFTAEGNSADKPWASALANPPDRRGQPVWSGPRTVAQPRRCPGPRHADTPVSTGHDTRGPLDPGRALGRLQPSSQSLLAVESRPPPGEGSNVP